jgi:CHAT domain-containing protein
LAPYQYIVFATHGILGTEVPYLQQPALVLSQVDTLEEDGFLTMEEILGLRLNADLVTLSACQTGLGINVKGEGIIGLTRAFMYAGTSSLVVSLWSVADQSTAEFMAHFYRNLKSGMSKAKALRETKLWMIRESYHTDEYGNVVLHNHPFYWAPFVLIGEYQ